MSVSFFFKHLNLWILFAVFVVSGSFSNNFISMGNFENILTNTVYMAVLSMGMFFVVLVKGIDISLGAIVYLSGIVLAELSLNGYPLFTCVLIVAASGILLGAVNGFFVAIVGVTPFLATLFTMIIFRGIGKWITKSAAYDYTEMITNLASLKIGPIPFWVVVVVLLFSAAYLFLKYLPIGRYFYAVGYNREIASKSGIRVHYVTFAAYCFSGFFGSIASIILASQIGRHSAGIGELDELDAITAVALGGVSLFGGIGNILGAVFGAFTVQAVNAGLVFAKVNLYLQPMVTAIILFIAVAANAVFKKKH